MSNVPAVPNIPPLSSIEDPNTRAVLQAIISGQRIRNGEVGDGEEKFLTVGDLNGAFQIVRGGGILGSSGGTRQVVAGRVATMLAGLVGDITESRLWKLLGERIQQIDWMQTPEWFGQRFGAAIKTEQLHREIQGQALAGQITTAVARAEHGIAIAEQRIFARVNENLSEATAITNLQAEYDQYLGLSRVEGKVVTDASGTLASQVTTLQTAVGGGASGTKALAEEGLILKQTAESVNAAYTVKFDMNGYVCGAGLHVEGKTGSTPQSDFIVRADRFAIGSPEAPTLPARIPFSVTTTPQIIGGVTYPAGVWIDAAFIADATIDTAHIKDLTVDTIKIKNGAVTLTQFANGSLDLTTVGSAWVDVMEMPFTVSGMKSGEIAGCIFGSSSTLLGGSGTDSSVDVGIFVREKSVPRLTGGDSAPFSTSVTIMGALMEVSVMAFATVPNGEYIATIRVKAGSMGAPTRNLEVHSYITLMGGKR